MPGSSPRALPERLYGIVGKPVGHSLSPLLHNWAFNRLGHPGVYFAWEKDRGQLADFMKAVRSLPVHGLSVTIPHKESVAEFLDALTPGAQAVGAVNTLFWRDGTLWGDNTDVTGFLSPLGGSSLSGLSSTSHLDAGSGADCTATTGLPQRALLLGGGGVSRAALAGLRELGFSDVMVAVRSPDKARALADDFGCRLIPWDERERVALDMESVLLINATPLGMRGRDQDSSPLPESFWTRLADRGGKACSTVAYDLVYTPVETLFLRQAKSKGFRTIDGLSFFMAQAREQFRLWTGLDMPDDVAAKARELVLSRL